jgi:two-component system sensor histidine kinase UhpB
MDISWLERHRAAPEEQAAEKLQGMTKLVDATITTVQRISSALRPGILDSLSLASAVEWLAEDFKKRSGITCRVDCVYESSHGERHETILFRILQEALTNIARHSGATEVHVTLEDNGDSISLEVRDNGRGISKKQVEDHQSLGIIGMRERVQYLSGSLAISGKRGQGTTVRIVLPVEQQ